MRLDAVYKEWGAAAADRCYFLRLYLMLISLSTRARRPYMGYMHRHYPDPSLMLA